MSFTRLVSVLSSVKRGGRGLLSSPSPILLWIGYFATFTLVMTQISSLWLAQQLSCATPSLVLRNFCSLSRCVSMLLNCRCAQLLSHILSVLGPTIPPSRVCACEPVFGPSVHPSIMCSVVWLFATPWMPGSSVHGIFQPRILEWLAISSSRGSSQHKDQTHVFCITGGFFTAWAIGEAPYVWSIVGTHLPVFLVNHPIPTSPSPLEGTL